MKMIAKQPCRPRREWGGGSAFFENKRRLRKSEWESKCARRAAVAVHGEDTDMEMVLKRVLLGRCGNP